MNVIKISLQSESFFASKGTLVMAWVVLIPKKISTWSLGWVSEWTELKLDQELLLARMYSCESIFVFSFAIYQ